MASVPHFDDGDDPPMDPVAPGAGPCPDPAEGWIRETLIATAASLMIARDRRRPEQMLLVKAAQRDLIVVAELLAGTAGPSRRSPA